MTKVVEAVIGDFADAQKPLEVLSHAAVIEWVSAAVMEYPFRWLGAAELCSRPGSVRKPPRQSLRQLLTHIHVPRGARLRFFYLRLLRQ